MTDDRTTARDSEFPPEAETKPSPETVPGTDSDDEIVLTDGKTLSDYLDEEAAASKPVEAPDHRSIPNAERAMVPPPMSTARPGGEGGRIASLPAPSPSPGEEDFREMLEGSLKARSFEDGDRVQGRVVAIGPAVAFLDVGGKSEAQIDIEELKDPEGGIEVSVGDMVEALVVSTEGGLKLSRRLALGAAARGRIADAFHARLPVEGRVEKAIKGGFEVRIAGQRGFCPVSQIDIVRTAEPASHEGKLYTFRIIEYKEGGRDIVVSRRAILQEEDNRRADETRKSIVPGAILNGRVVSVREYGAFVDLGGVQGLLHVSEMGWSRVTTPAEIVKPGDEITVKVLRIDEGKGRISLGLKQLQADPWSKVGETYAVGQVRTGRVVRLQEFGAFVELAAGIEALAHVSTFPPTGTAGGWKKSVAPGTTGEFEVLTIDLERKRIGVALVGEDALRAGEAAGAEPRGADEAAGSPPESREGLGPDEGVGSARPAVVTGARVKGKVERHESFGVFVYLAPGRTGLMPSAETGTQRGADLKKAFPIGSEVEVLVIDVDPSGKRIRLSRKAFLEVEERADARDFTSRREVQESFGSIGEKLRAALAARQK